MKKFGMRWILLILVIGSMWATCARAEWSFIGDRLVDDFDGEVFPGWNPSETTDKIFLAGDYFLGPSTNVELF